MVSPLYIKIYSKHTKTAYWAKMSIFQAFLVKISNFELSNWVPLLLCSIRSSNYSNIDSIIKYDTLYCRNIIFDLIPLNPIKGLTHFLGLIRFTYYSIVDSMIKYDTSYRRNIIFRVNPP